MILLKQNIANMIKKLVFIVMEKKIILTIIVKLHHWNNKLI